MEYVIYYRVSTQKQGTSGLGLQAQKRAVEQFLSNNNVTTPPITFTDIESGRNNDRPNLLKAIERCKETGSTLIVARLDRLSRNAAFLFKLRDELHKNNVDFRALDIPELNTLTLGVLASMAQHESELISQRTKAAIQAKREREEDWHPGTPQNLTDEAREKGRQTVMRKARENQAERFAWHYIAPRLKSMTYAEIADKLNVEGYTTSRGNKFYPSTIRRIFVKYYDEYVE